MSDEDNYGDEFRDDFYYYMSPTSILQSAPPSPTTYEDLFQQVEVPVSEPFFEIAKAPEEEDVLQLQPKKAKRAKRAKKAEKAKKAKTTTTTRRPKQKRPSPKTAITPESLELVELLESPPESPKAVAKKRRKPPAPEKRRKTVSPGPSPSFLDELQNVSLPLPLCFKFSISDEDFIRAANATENPQTAMEMLRRFILVQWPTKSKGRALLIWDPLFELYELLATAINQHPVPNIDAFLARIQRMSQSRDPCNKVIYFTAYSLLPAKLYARPATGKDAFTFNTRELGPAAVLYGKPIREIAKRTEEGLLISSDDRLWAGVLKDYLKSNISKQDKKNVYTQMQQCLSKLVTLVQNNLTERENYNRRVQRFECTKERKKRIKTPETLQSGLAIPTTTPSPQQEALTVTRRKKKAKKTPRATTAPRKKRQKKVASPSYPALQAEPMQIEIDEEVDEAELQAYFDQYDGAPIMEEEPQEPEISEESKELKEVIVEHPLLESINTFIAAYGFDPITSDEITSDLAASKLAYRGDFENGGTLSFEKDEPLTLLLNHNDLGDGWLLAINKFQQIGLVHQKMLK